VDDVEGGHFQGPDVEAVAKRLKEETQEPQWIAYVSRQQRFETAPGPVRDPVASNLEEDQSDVDAERRSERQSEGCQVIRHGSVLWRVGSPLTLTLSPIGERGE